MRNLNEESLGQTPEAWAEKVPEKRWTAKQRLVLALARWLGPALIRAYGAIVTVKLAREFPPEVRSDPRQPSIHIFWHRCLIPVAFHLRDQGFGILISQHFDGEWIAQICERLGYAVFRGSSTRGGREALLQIADWLVRGNAIGFTADGPRGPKFRAKPGFVYLARTTGAPIYAFHVSMPKAWELNSWDRFQIPKPFSTVLGDWCGPFYVPADATATELETIRLQVENQLNLLRERNDAAALAQEKG